MVMICLQDGKRLAFIYKYVPFPKDSVVLDYGGGRGDLGLNFLKEHGCLGRIYDPYNRSPEYNEESLNIIKSNGGADIIVCSSVYNVIRDPAEREECSRNMYNLLKPDGIIYFSTYEGNRSGVPVENRIGHQSNRKTQTYIPELEKYFTVIKIVNVISQHILILKRKEEKINVED